MPGNIDNIDISLESGSFSGANVQGRNDENDNDGHFDVRLPLNSDRDDSGFHRKEFVKALLFECGPTNKSRWFVLVDPPLSIVPKFFNSKFEL
jgi:hypothetical protein